LIALVISVALHAWSTSGLAAPSADAQPIEARLEIDTRDAGGGAEVLHRRIEERANIALREGKVLPGDDDDVAITITVREIIGDEPGYAVIVDLRRRVGSLLDAPFEIACPLCTETELVARVEAELDTVIQELRELEAKHEQPAEPSPTLATVEPEPDEPVINTPPRTGMLASGITLLVLGSGSLGAGVGLAIPEPKIDEENPLDLITTRPVGYACLAGGIAAVVAGAVLTALAVERRRQPKWSVAPFGGRSRAGIVIGGSF
jgi:hypothetical protein